MILRVAVYCRYSTELQDETSIEDQAAHCRDFIKRHGWNATVTVYSDAAISGASRLNRPGFLRMIDDMAAGKIDRIVIENISRLARDVEDSAFTMKRAKFHRVKIFCANEGGVELTSLSATFSAMAGQMAREQGADMIRRSMTGLVRAGKSAGGRSYGYRSLPRLDADRGRGGDLRIEEAEAEIVLEIFTRYAAGESPLAIVTDLNRRGVPSPRSSEKTLGVWRASTLNGNKDRSTGILHNPLYAGKRVWNRVAMEKNPDTALRVSRSNQSEDWIESEVEELRIVPQELWRPFRRDLSNEPSSRSVGTPKRPSGCSPGFCGVVTAGPVSPATARTRAGACGYNAPAKRKQASAPPRSTPMRRRSRKPFSVAFAASLLIRVCCAPMWTPTWPSAAVSRRKLLASTPPSPSGSPR
jgi:DNA invertase Pin-like site-specific DNA recombinase